jgi:hypothetical protein
MSNQIDEDTYEPIPISDNDQLSIKLTHTFVVNGQTQWAAAEWTIKVLPQETSDEAIERCSALAQETVFQNADILAANIDIRRQHQLNKNNTEKGA